MKEKKNWKKKKFTYTSELLSHYTNINEKKEGKKKEQKTDFMMRILSKRSGAGRCQNLASMKTFTQCLESLPQHSCSTSKYSGL